MIWVLFLYFFSSGTHVRVTGRLASTYWYPSFPFDVVSYTLLRHKRHRYQQVFDEWSVQCIEE